MKTIAMLGAVIFTLFLPSITSSTPVLVPEVNETYPGTWVWVEGSGFPGDADFEMFLDNTSIENGTTYLGGQLSRKVTIARTISMGPHNIRVVAGSTQAAAEISVVQWPTSFSVTPDEVHPGEELEVVGHGYPPNAYYEVYIGSGKIVSGATDEGGKFSETYQLPKTVQLGLQIFTANATRYTGPPSSNQFVNVTQWRPNLSANPSTPRPGETIEIRGNALPPGSLYRIVLDGSEILRGGCDLQGEFYNVYSLPPNLPTGLHTLSVESFEYTGPPRAKMDLDVIQWNATLSTTPESLHPGMNVNIQGVDFPPRTPVQLRLSGTVIYTGNSSSSGVFSHQHYIPENISLGSYEAVATAPQFAGPPTASLALSIEQWPLNLSILGEEIHPGSNLQLLGHGFPPLAGFEIYLDDSVKILVGSTNSTGFLSGQYLLSKWLPLGPHSLRCTIKDYTGPPEITIGLNVSEWPLITQISPQEPHPGEGMVVTGSKFPPGSAYYIYLDDTIVTDGVVTSNQSFSAGFDLSRDISIGHHLLSIQSSFPNQNPLNQTFEVKQWPVALYADEYHGMSGDPVNLAGHGFPPETSVKILFNGIYVKVAQTNQAGNFSTVLIIPEDDVGIYHKITANESRGYSGPPSVKLFYWLGDFPPQMDGQVCDGDGVSDNLFFVGDGIHVKGTGFPPIIPMLAHIVNPGNPVEGAIISTSTVTTDSAGFLPVTMVDTAVEAGPLELWLDVNSNYIFDANDLILEPFQVSYRPDLEIRHAALAEMTITQGQMVDVDVEVKNNGKLPSEGSIVLIFRGVQVYSATFDPIPTGGVEKLTVNWDTSSSPLGSGELIVRISPLPGENNIEDNDFALGIATLLERPDISIQWINPPRREIHRGREIRIPVRLINRSPFPQATRLSLIWGGEEVAHREVSIPGESSLTFDLDWEPKLVALGSRALAASVEVLPYEKNPADNLLENGTMRVMLPNHPPDGDPNGPYTGYPGELVQFDGSLSFDVDGEIVTYRWEFGDGNWSLGERASHSYHRAGTYNVTLTTVDDDGDLASVNTTAYISSKQTETLSLMVYDGIKQTPKTGARVEIASTVYFTGEEPLTIELRRGLWKIRISKEGYQEVEEEVLVERDQNLNFMIRPSLQLLCSDADGKTRKDFAETEYIFVSITAPDNYPALIYVLPDGGASDGQPLLDVSYDGQEYVLTSNGTIVRSIWGEHTEPGSYDIILDINSNGLYEKSSDVSFNQNGPAFKILEIFISPFLVLFLVGIAGRRSFS